MSSRNFISQFKSEGTLERRGEFQIDREKAREKMRKFQLSDPHAYVLEFVKAATMLGATKIFFGIDADEMRMTCDCEPLTEDELDNLYGAAFSKLDSERARALRHFAIGFTAAEALDLSTIEITSIGEDHGARYTLVADEPEPQETIESIDPGLRKTEIYFKKRFRASHVLDFIRKFSDQFAENKHLTEKVGFAEIPIYLRRSTEPLSEPEMSHASTRLSFGRSVATEIPYEFETKTDRCVMGLTSETPSRIQITQHGVLIADHSHTSRPCFEAVVESTRLTTDLTQSAFVEDAAYHDLIGALKTYRLTHLAVRTYALMKAENTYQHPWRLLEKDVDLQATLERFVKQSQQRKEGGALPLDYQRFAERLENFDTWPLATSSPESPKTVNYTSIANIREAGAICISQQRDRELEVPGHPVILFSRYGVSGSVSGFPLATLGQYLDLEVVDVTEKIQERQDWHDNRRRWLDRPWSSKDFLDIHASAEFEREDLKCTLSIRGGKENLSKLVWVKDGKILYDSSLSDMHISRLLITIEGDVEPNARFDGPAPTELNKGIELRYLLEIPNLIESYATTLNLLNGTDKRFRTEDLEACEFLISYVDHLVRGNLLSGILAASSFDWNYKEVRPFLAGESAHFALTPSPSIDQAPEALESGGRRITHHMWAEDEITPADLSEVANALGDLGKAPIFQEFDGSGLSLHDLAEIFEQQGAVYVIHERLRNQINLYEEIRVLADIPELYERNKANTGRIIWSSDLIDRVLYNLIGSKAQSALNRLLFQERKRVFLEKPVLDFELPAHDYAMAREVDSDVAQVKIGMRPPNPDDFDAAFVDIRYEGRRVLKSLHHLKAGVFEVVVELTGGLLPDRSFKKLEEGHPQTKLFQAIETGCFHLICSWISSFTETFDGPESLPVDEGHFWSLAARLVPTGELTTIVVAQSEHEDDIKLADLRRYARQNTLAYYRDYSSPVRELLPSQNIQVLKVRERVPIEELADFEWIDVSQTPEQLKAIERSRRAFMAKPVRELEAAGLPESRIQIKTDSLRGEVRVSQHDTTSQESRLSIWFCYESRAVVRENYTAFVPFGRYEAVVDGKSFKLNADFTQITGDKDAAAQYTRRAAQDSFIALCDAWDSSAESRSDRNREILTGALVKSLSADSWPKACERIRATKLFEMADGSMASYDDLVQISAAEGNVYWLFSFWRTYKNPGELYSVAPSSVVLADSPNFFVEDPSRLQISDASRFQVSGTPRIVKALKKIPWRAARETVKDSAETPVPRQRVSGASSTKPKSAPRKPLEEETHPVVEALESHFETISRSNGEARALANVKPLKNIVARSVGADAALSRISAGQLELNIDHPAVDHYLTTEHDAALAFLGAALLASLNGHEKRRHKRVRELVGLYSRGLRTLI